MAWQDDLNNLDEELSAGRIRSDEYRRRRDELLAAASSNLPSARRINRQQPASIANAFTGDAQSIEFAAEVTQQVEIIAAPSEAPWTSTPPNVLIPQLAEPPVRNAVPSPSPMQGSEVFGLSVAPVNRRRRWPKFVVVLLVLALGTVAVWWFLLRDDSPTPAASSPPATTGQFTVDRLPNPTDVPLSTSGELTIDQAQIQNLIKPDEAGYLSASATQKIFYRQVVTGNISYQIFYFQVAPSSTGASLATRIVERGAKLGMTPVPGLPAGVTGLESLAADAGILEAVYPTDHGTVRVVIGQVGKPQESVLAGALKKAVTTVIAVLPHR